MEKSIPITIAYGDGIGPEIMTATRMILDAAKVPLQYETIEIGEKLYLQGVPSGIDASSWESLRKTKVFFKSPITTPQGGGVKSLNVTVRKTLSLFANVRPCVSYYPCIQTKHPKMDVVIVRENEEDLYAGIEHRQTPEVFQCLKLISREGCERIIRYAFEYAEKNERKKVSCFTKDNIMKMTDGLFHKTFDEIAAEYPHIEHEHWIIDIGTAMLADSPEKFDVIVTLNLYGDIISDVAAQITGSVGLGGSANIGDNFAMFEAIHGSAPTIAGQNIANPSGLILAAIQMLVHLGLPQHAETIHNAWLKTIEDGMHTTDIYNQKTSKELVGTKEFAEKVIQRLGQSPQSFTPVSYASKTSSSAKRLKQKKQLPDRKLYGVDVFLYSDPKSDIDELGAKLKKAETDAMKLTIITNRGLKVWPDPNPETVCTDHWRCRFVSESKNPTHEEIVKLFGQILTAGLEFIKSENLYTFDGKPGFTKAQGE